MTIRLNLIQDVKDFVDIASRCSFDVTLESSGYAVNGKSILGILSLDLTNPVKVVIINVPDVDEQHCFYKAIERFRT